MKNLIFKNGDAMPLLGLGTWKSRPKEIYTAVRSALELGYRHIDCAAIYGNEKEIGQALDDAFRAGDIAREDLWITSKLWNNSHRKGAVENALKQTLAELRLDCLDLYLVHWPVAFRPEVVYPSKGADFLSLEEVPLLETWDGMAECAAAGLARHIGVSNFSVKKLDTLIQHDMPPEVNQIELHPYLQQPEMLDFCRKHYIHLTAYAPLGSPDRPSALKRQGEPSLLDNEIIADIAGRNNCTPAQVLIAWALQRGTAVIPKSVNPEGLGENLAAAEIWLDKEEMAAVSTLEKGYRFVSGEFWTMEGSPYSLETLWDE